ncbi:Histidine phosphatase family protein [Sulfidibacter corallicola]|uniref:Histidine phosphatase family protein n=1 Tax=Sulfidibacter corallicola TaxID=2818388 RepID=A0A8A4TR75_SULCO|nr:histidine phosphatase family protein [Sulfidibacter corallicola]QTD49025.1 histidine phosphatase family protein [Sulfidibacter corallicola]
MRFMMLLMMAMGIWVQAGEVTLVYLVRHAEKVDSSDDAGLTEAGQARADKLATFFSRIPLAGVYATEYKRTQLTAAPVAKVAGQSVTVIGAREAGSLVKAVHAAKGKALFVAGHSNTVPQLIEMLGGPEVHIDHADYDNLFLLMIHDDRAVLQNFRFTP